MDGECLSVTVVEKVTKIDTLGGYVFLVFLFCLILGFILGLLLARCILRELEVLCFLELECKKYVTNYVNMLYIFVHVAAELVIKLNTIHVELFKKFSKILLEFSCG